MKIYSSQVTKLTITEVPRLDPITVFAEDLGPHHGKITIECYGKSWSGSWKGMPGSSITDFVRSSSVDYLAGKMTDERDTITDADSIKDGARRQIIKMRRGEVAISRLTGRIHRLGRDEITAAKARALWEYIDIANVGDDGSGDSKLMQEIFGDEWWLSLPTRQNPNHQYLCCIISAVQNALNSMKEQDHA